MDIHSEFNRTETSISSAFQWCWTSTSPTTARHWGPEPSRSSTNTSRPTTASPSASALGRYCCRSANSLPSYNSSRGETFLLFLLRSPRPSTCSCAGTWTDPPLRSSRNTCPGSRTTSGRWKLVCAPVDVLETAAQRSELNGKCRSVPGSDWTAWRCRWGAQVLRLLCSLQWCASA